MIPSFFYFFKKKFGKMKAMFWGTGDIKCLVVEFLSSFTLLGQVTLLFSQIRREAQKRENDVLPKIIVSELKI